MTFRLMLTALVICLTGCSTIQVSSDYDPKFNFSRLQTFSVLYNQSSAGDALNQERIAKALITELETKGYTETEKKFADFFIVFHTQVKQKTQVVTDYKSVGLYPYRYWNDRVVPVQRSYSYKKGKILVDAVTPDKVLFWRGIATDRLKTLETPEERTAYIDKVIKDVLKSFPAKKDNNGNTPSRPPESPFGRYGN